MNEEQPRWYDRQLASNVVGGVVVAVLVWFVPWVISEATKAKVPWWVYLIVLGAALLLGSAVVPTWRRAIWGNARRFIKWAATIRPLTAAQRTDLDQSGYARRSAEVDAERANPFDPVWKIDVRDSLGFAHTYFLENSGFEVWEVTMTCDPEFFVLKQEAHFPGGLGTDQRNGYVASPFFGAPTDRGKAEGVIFHIKWKDRHGDWHERDVVLPPDEILAGRDVELSDAFNRGFSEGRAQGNSDPAPLPLPSPRWSVYADNSGDHQDWILRNSVPRSVAREVRIESDGDLHIIDAGHWADLSGGDEGALGSFQGTLSRRGEESGVVFNITWYDESGVRKSDQVTLPGSNSEFY